MTRVFEDRPATRDRVPLFVGLAGASGSGKTFSALRLATGMQRVTGGEIYFIDTEARRALHYADGFTFRHVPFVAPFSPLDYLEVIEFCAKKNAGVIVIDSMSHEHEGPGGVLEWHEREMGGDFKRQMLAWAKPKAARRRLLNTVVQLGVNLVMCFRAKEKLKLAKRDDKDKEPKELGWMPIAGEEFVYEMTTSALLYPASGGVPTWSPTLPGERAMTKLPMQFESIFAKRQPLSEDVGAALAQWAAGNAATPSAQDLATLLERVTRCATATEIDDLAKASRQSWTPEQRAQIKQAFDAQRAEIKSTPAAGIQTETESSASAGAGVSPWTAGGESRCVECKRLRSRIGHLGHEDGCSLGGEK